MAGLQRDEFGQPIPPWEVESDPAPVESGPTIADRLSALESVSTVEERVDVLMEVVRLLHEENRALRNLIYAVGRER